MKKTITYISKALLIIIVAVACNKELTNDDLIVSFNIEFTDTTLDSFLNNPKATNFGITNTEGTVENYQIKYEVTEGSGYFLINATRVEANEFVSLPEATQQTIEYVGTTVGVNNIIITIKDAFNNQESAALTYNVKDTSFTFDVTATPAVTFVDGISNLTLSISEVSAADYEVSYSFISADADTTGSGAISAAGEVIEANAAQILPSGDTSWEFKGITQGTVEILFTAKSSLGVTEEKSISIVIGEIPDFTFTATTAAIIVETNTEADINFDLVETTGMASHIMTFTSTKAGSLVYEGTTYQSGEDIPINSGMSTGQYIGEVAGNHTIEFMVSNNNPTPVVNTAEVSLTFQDQMVDVPVIILEGANPQIILVGEMYTELGAIANEGSSVTIDNSAVDTTTPGEYMVVYTATNTFGTSTANRTVIVNDNPVAAITATPIIGMAPLTVNFSASTSTNTIGNLTLAKWNFGDGSVVNSAAFPNAVSHIYTNPGSYIVTLTIEDEYGAQGTTTRMITVNSDVTPTYDNTTRLLTGNPGAAVSFTFSAGTSASNFLAEIVMRRDAIDGPEIPNTKFSLGPTNTSANGSFVMPASGNVYVIACFGANAPGGAGGSIQISGQSISFNAPRFGPGAVCP